MRREPSHGLASGAVADLEAELAAEVRSGSAEVDRAGLDPAVQLRGEGEGRVRAAAAVGLEVGLGTAQVGVQDRCDAAGDVLAEPGVRDDPADPRSRCGGAQPVLEPVDRRAVKLAAGPHARGLAQRWRGVYNVHRYTSGCWSTEEPDETACFGAAGRAIGRALTPGLSSFRDSTTPGHPARSGGRLSGGACSHHARAVTMVRSRTVAAAPAVSSDMLAMHGTAHGQAETRKSLKSLQSGMHARPIKSAMNADMSRASVSP